MKLNQDETIKNHLEKYGSITQLEAFKKYGISRLSARIYNLRAEGLNIITTRKKVKSWRWGTTTVANYVLVKEK